MSMDDYIDLPTVVDAAIADYPANWLYCLADHAGVPGLHRTLVDSRLPWRSLFQGASEDAALAAAPLLFSLGGRGERVSDNLLHWLSTHGTFTSSLLLLSSPLTLDELRARLARRLHACVSEGMNVLLRFFDPRIFESLLTVLEYPQRDWFLSPADCWWYGDRYGVLQSWPSKHGDTEINFLLRLSETQEFALLDASEIDQVAAQLRSMLPDGYAGLGIASRTAFLRRHMAEANSAGIVATHELALYCGLALLYGEDFSRTLRWQALLIKVQSGSATFAEAVAAQEASHGERETDESF